MLENQVVAVRTEEKEGYNALQIGAVDHNNIRRVSINNCILKKLVVKIHTIVPLI